MAVNFPASPVDGQTLTSGGITWSYSTSIGAWRIVPNTIQGVQGIQGTTGTSIQGTTGTSVQGTTGTQGFQGIQGLQGISVQGLQGPSGAGGGVTTFSAGSTGFTPSSATAGAVTLAGTLAIASGGTNASATPTAGGSAYGTGSAYAFTAAGTSGQALVSAGASAPAFATLTLENLPGAWPKKSVRAATTGSITLSGTQTIDGISVVVGDRVLVKNQGTASQNGIYIVASGTWTRATDADTADEIAGAAVNVDQGSTLSGELWKTDFLPTSTVGTTSMNWYRVLDTSSSTGSGSVVLATSPVISTANLTVSSGTTSSPVQVVKVEAVSTGTPAAGFGGSIDFVVESAGGSLRTGARIAASMFDATNGSEDFDIRFYTMNGGATATEAFRIDNSGVPVTFQTTPATFNTTGTITIANMLTRIITSTTAAAVTATLPSGTNMDGGFNSPWTSMAFDWTVINTGPNLFTVQAGSSHTIVGVATVPTTTSATFRSRRTGGTTWVTYRL